ncbi:DUF433 domain-containing protein [Roseibium aggregatum]|uniref:DUF433 domain-containing protein n=1 Tax=Roseibium aggregatum TaxID=187304 RepID=A0A926NQQ8_9HYPH|nr:DUF433 domain-containing protein [Roseibium aggregatum]MBD1544699.1 DUF433 domain-containing protein [Roseibium aggregatum]
MDKRDSETIVSAFTEEQVERLTGISKRQLRYWDRINFFAPSMGFEDRNLPYSRIYSFRDIVCLKVLDRLRNEAKVSLAHLRGVKDKLSHLGDDLWLKTTLYVLNKKVVIDNPETSAKEEVVSGQGVFQIPLKIVTGDLKNAVLQSRKRDDSDIGHFEKKKGIARNQLVISGTRIPVRSIKAFAEAGYSVAEILREYPTLTEKDVKAAIEYEEAA